MAKNHASDTDFKRNQKPYNMHREHWEIKYHEKPANDEKNQVMGSCFNPTNTKNRFKTYVPVNETDT
jgi:hypothetical protein